MQGHYAQPASETVGSNWKRVATLQKKNQLIKQLAGDDRKPVVQGPEHRSRGLVHCKLHGDDDLGSGAKKTAVAGGSNDDGSPKSSEAIPWNSSAVADSQAGLQ